MPPKLNQQLMATWTARLDTDFKQTITLKDSSGTVFDPTAHTLTCEVRRWKNGAWQEGAQLAAISESSGITITDAGAGEVDIEFTDTQINAIGVGKHKLDIMLQRDSDSYKFRTVTVDLEVLGRVTAPA